MNIIFLSPSLNPTDGWNRYARDIVMRMRTKARVSVLCHGACPSLPEIVQLPTLRKPIDYLSQPLLVVWDALRVRKLVRGRCREGEENIVHATAEGYALFAPFLRGLGVRMIMTVHGTYSVLPLRSWKTRWLYAWTYQSIDRVIAVSDYTKRHLLRHAAHCLPEEKICVVLNGVDYREKPPRQPRRDGVFRILTVGEVKYRKGGHHLVRVARMLREHYRFPFLITFVGKVEEKSAYIREIRSYLREHDLESCVQLLGVLPQDALDEQYRMADLFVLLSVHEGGHYEGYPLVFHEAAMWGLPSIGSYDCGAEDAIRNGETGILVHPGNHDEVAAVIANIRSGAIQFSPEQCRAWARMNDWSTKRLEEMYVF